MTTDPRIAVLSALSSPDWHPVPEAHGMPWDEAEQLLAAYDASRDAAAVVSPPPDRVTAIYDTIDAFQREHRTGGGLGHAQIRALLAEHLARALPASSAPATDRAALVELTAQAMREHYLVTDREEADADGNLPCRCGDWREPGAEGDDENDWDSHLADAVLSVLPANTDRARALALLEAADLLRDAHFRDGLSVQEIGTALRHLADEADPMAGSLARDGFGLDEIAAMSDPAVLPASGDRGAVLREAADAVARFTGNDLDANAKMLRRMAGETPPAETQPRRGDAFEAWLKAQRAEFERGESPWPILDYLLDRYRLHADTGTPLGEHVCEGRTVGDCDCLEKPAERKRPPMDPVHILGIEADGTRDEVVHGCPPDGSGLTPCCGRTPFELPLTDRISSEAPVTCPAAAPEQPAKEA
jgi:hypothetical protein